MSILLIIISFLFSCQSVPGFSETEENELEINVSVPIIPDETTMPKDLEKQEDLTQNLTDKSSSDSFTQLSNEKIEKIILNTVPGSFLPVTKDDGSIKIIYRDLDQNGYKDAFFLVVKNREDLNPNFSNLSDVSNLLKDDRMGVDFFLSVFLQLQGSMISMFRIPIGSSAVISDFKVIPIKEGSDLPLGINISFQTVKGTDREWIIFSSYNKFSLFSMAETISTYSDPHDIDGDNVIDIVDWEDGLEEGTGYETYLTWYKWNGREYREYRSTNIVRNLNGFLEQSGLYLSFKQTDEFFRYSLSSEDSIEYKNSSKKYSDWLSRIFRPVPGSNSESDNFEDCSKIRSVIFPPIFENPYTPGNNALHICNLNVRFVCDDGYSFIRTARIEMNPNPFKKQQFSFYLE